MFSIKSRWRGDLMPISSPNIESCSEKRILDGESHHVYLVITHDSRVPKKILNDIRKYSMKKSFRSKIYVFTDIPSPYYMNKLWDIVFENIRDTLLVYERPLEPSLFKKMLENEKSESVSIYIDKALSKFVSIALENGFNPIVI
jgi:hypothetical protein